MVTARRGVPILLAVAVLAASIGSAPVASARPGTVDPSSLPRPTPMRRDGLTRALLDGSITTAEYALERALSLFHPKLVEARFGPIDRPNAWDATMILRDLFIRKTSLSGTEARQADALLARPDDHRSDFPGAVKWSVPEAPLSPYCSADVCVHWVDSTADAPPLTDNDADGIPDWVQTTDATLENVWTQEVTTMGYRRPEDDSSSRNNGDPNGELDVYLADTLSDGFYGYTTSDDPNNPPPYDVSAYMVLDNDFVLGGADPEALLDVTAAHEFFHAVQFAYDAWEDRWMMEATAVWMEGEVYPSIHDNYGYLPYGPLGVPGVPLDKGGNGLHQYGSWIYFRFLSEFFGQANAEAEDPTIVREIWNRASARRGDPDLYSTAAIARAISARGDSFGDLFATFTQWAAAPSLTFEDGASYPAATVSQSVTLRATSPSVPPTSFVLDHLSNAYVALRPGAGVSGTARLRVVVDGPAISTGTEASIVLLRKDGSHDDIRISLDSNGNGARSVAFGKGTIAKAFVILTNASRRFKDCQPHTGATIWSCSGIPRDDNETYRYSARIV